MTEITARHKVFAHLRKSRAVSAREIARALKMTAPNVRHHLSVLVSDGRVAVNESRPRGGRGRPEKLYALSEAARGDNLASLAKALLVEAGPSVQMDEVADHILDPNQFVNLAASKRLALIVDKLNEMHYQAHWEAGAEGPRVIFGRCPYVKIIDAHPELCRMDAEMLKGALGNHVEQVAKIEKMHGACIFVKR